MKYVIYADSIFFWNFIINITLIYVLSKLIPVGIHIFSVLIWSALTALITEFVYFITLSQNIRFYHIFYVASYIIMIYLFFHFKLKLSISKLIPGIFYTLFLICGALSILNINKNTYLTSGFLSIFLFLIFIKITYKKIFIYKNTRKNIWQIAICSEEKKIKCNGLIDTGNMLKDSYTKKPMIVIDYRLMQSFLTKAEFNSILQYNQTGYFNYEVFSTSNIRFYPTPYHTIDCNLSLMPTFKIPSLIFLESGMKYENIPAGISRHKINNKNNYQVLLNESLKPNREEHPND